MMNANVFTSEWGKRGACFWLVVCLALLGTLLALLPTARLNSSVLALLPGQTTALPQDLNDGFMSRLDSQVLWLVSSGNAPDPAVAEYWASQLRTQPFFSTLTGALSQTQQQDWGRFFFEHRNGNIDAQTRDRLQNGTQAQWILTQIYSAFSGVSSNELRNDPLMLVRGAQLSLAQNGSQLKMMQGWLVTQDSQGRYWYLIHGELAGSTYDMARTHQIVTQLNTLEAQLAHRYPQARLLSRGTVFYSDYASQQAKDDISTLGTVTLAGILLLIILVFRSFRPLLLCMLSIAIGGVAGSVAVLMFFGELHMMTLVMSMSIIGISADYTLYYLTERMVHGDSCTPQDSLKKVQRALLMALVTTVIAWLVMMIAPFPGIRQMAVFATTGLMASCLTVFFWHPSLCHGMPVRPVPCMGLLLRWLSAWRRRKTLYIGLPCTLAVIACIGISRLHIDDDIAQLQALPEALLTQERAITGLTGQSVEQKWFAVYGDTAQSVLERLEKLRPILDQARQQGLFDNYRTIPLNSLARQQTDLALIRQTAPDVIQQLAAAGIPNAHINTDAMPVSLTDWLASPASEGWRLLWLTLSDGRSGVLIPVDQVHDSAALSRLAERQEGVVWVDRKVRFDHLFALYRHLLSGLLLIAVGVVACSAILRTGVKKGFISLVPSVLSLACGLAALALTSQTINLFSLLALVLVLGIGINYTLFFSNPRGTPLTSLLAVTLAMATTLLTLGMLVFSHTQAISNFGVVLCSGIFTAFLLSPLAMPNKRERKK